MDHRAEMDVEELDPAGEGDEVQWSDVIEIRTRNLVEFLVTYAMDEHVVAVVPLRWFPGRKRVVNAIGRALLVLVVATAKETMERDFDLRVPPSDPR